VGPLPFGTLLVGQEISSQIMMDEDEEDGDVAEDGAEDETSDVEIDAEDSNSSTKENPTTESTVDGQDASMSIEY
jgi:hypothetical protein